jgi:hypothetical protein
MRPQGGDIHSTEQCYLDEMAKQQQKHAAKAERKAARKVAERQKLAPPTTDDKEATE